MQVPEMLSTAFGKQFQEWIAQFSVDQKLLPDISSIESSRFLSRSIVPHILKLSGLFNREEKNQAGGLDPYWKQSSHPAHLRLAYFLYFMPCNLFRMACIWNELARLGFRWQHQGQFRGIEFGAGPASGACGIAAGEKVAVLGLPQSGSWALIEQDRSMLELGSRWAEAYFSHLDFGNWGIRPFHRKLDPSQGFLPANAPRFHLWLMSYYLNEVQLSPKELAPILIKSWAKHLEDEGVVILIEPALKLQSRRLLELRQELLALREKSGGGWQILLPCIGHQACGALKQAEDWCHEDVLWWRPPYFRILDQMAGLDRKSLPFSYLVIVKSPRPREEILPRLGAFAEKTRYRLVSPAHREGRDSEFFVCGQEGKRRARYRFQNTDPQAGEVLQRGDILIGAEIRGDQNASRISHFEKA